MVAEFLCGECCSLQGDVHWNGGRRHVPLLLVYCYDSFKNGSSSPFLRDTKLNTREGEGEGKGKWVRWMADSSDEMKGRETL